MKATGLELEDYGDSKIAPLYNAWNRKTCFMSVGNTKVEEWDRLLEYCKNHPQETADFFLDLRMAYEEAYKEGYLGSPGVGPFVIELLDHTFPEYRPELSDGNGKPYCYVPPQILQDLWTIILTEKFHKENCNFDIE